MIDLKCAFRKSSTDSRNGELRRPEACELRGCFGIFKLQPEQLARALEINKSNGYGHVLALGAPELKDQGISPQTSEGIEPCEAAAVVGLIL